MQWPSQSPDLMQFDLKRAVHKGMSTNFNELKQQCKNFKVF